MHVVPNRQSRGACWLPQKQKMPKRSRSSRPCPATDNRRGCAGRHPSRAGFSCFAFPSGTQVSLVQRLQRLPVGATTFRGAGAGAVWDPRTPDPAPVPRTRVTPHPCSTRGCTGHRQASGARAADGSLMGLPALGTHLRQGPPVHVGTAQVDMPSVHDPEFGVQNAPGELPQGHEPHLGTWPGGEDGAVTGVSPGVHFTVSPVPRGGTACSPSEQSC